MNTPPPLPSSNSSDDKLWIILCHVSVYLGVGLLLPLVVYCVKKQESSLIAMHAKEALNFHISVLIYSIVALCLCLIVIGIPLLFLIGAFSLICPIIACLKVSENAFFRYPLTIRFLT